MSDADFPELFVRPDRYILRRRGTQDQPDGRYFVLELTRSMAARVALRVYVNQLRLEGLAAQADEVARLLDETAKAFQTHVEKGNPKTSKKTSVRAARRMGA